MNLENILNKNEITFPEYWDIKKVIEILSTNDSTELPDIFDRSVLGTTNKLKGCVPNKPLKQTYSKYFKEILVEEVPDPKAELTFSELCQFGTMEQMRYINAHPGFDKSAWAIFKTDLAQYND